jgi:hypothetical protein
MKKRNPTANNEGGRNLFCSHYSDCLDHAITKVWDSWNCAECQFKNEVCPQEAKIPVYSDDIAYYEFGTGFSCSDIEGFAA